MSEALTPVSGTGVRLLSLSPGQDKAVETIERIMSIISIVGCIFVIISFLLIPNLKAKTFNRLLFYASWGNLFSNVATLIGTAGVRAGTSSSTCKAQATLIQWFLPADCLWAFCMALNVFLTFQSRTLSIDLRRLEKWYFAFCYGVPAVPALTYLFMDITRGTNYYGNALLWCWISKKHDALRLSTFYGPVWLVIFITMFLYAITGRHIYKGQVRNKLMQNALSNDFRRSDESPTPRYGNTPEPIIMTESDKTATQVTTLTRRDSFDLSAEFLAICNDQPVKVDEKRPMSKSIPIIVSNFGDGIRFAEEEIIPSTPPLRAHIKSDPSTDSRSSTPNSNIKVTTTITSASVPAPDQAFHLRHCCTGFPQEQPIRQPALRYVQQKINKGAKTYAQVAFLLYIVILAVWVPSTVNRVWGYIQPNKINFPLIIAAAFVLPLQGFFNTLIYLFTSRAEINRLWKKQFPKKVNPLAPSPQLSQLDRPSIRTCKSPDLATIPDYNDDDDEDDDEPEDETYNFPWHKEKATVQTEVSAV